MEEPGEHAWTKSGAHSDPQQSNNPNALSPIQAFVTSSAGPSDGSDTSQSEFKDLRQLSPDVLIRRSHQSAVPEEEGPSTSGIDLIEEASVVSAAKGSVLRQEKGDGALHQPGILSKNAKNTGSPPAIPARAVLSEKSPISAIKSSSKLRRSLTPDQARPPRHKRKGSLDSLLLPPNFTQSQVDATMHRRKSLLNPALNPGLNPGMDSSTTSPLRGHLVRTSSLGAPGMPLSGPEIDFWRPEVGSRPLVGSVKLHERMVFLCYKDPASWPPRIEAAEAERLPKRLASAIYMKRKVLPQKTKFALCEGSEGSECDVLIFPDMKRYSAVTHFDIDHLIEFLLTGKEKVLRSQRITGCHVFVCAHASRDARCGSCGPPLVLAFQAVVQAKGLEKTVHVRACSHVGGHAFAGNVIIYMEREGKIAGDWYGYVTPRDVPLIVEQHIEGGRIVDKLWRGAMGLTAEEQQAELRRIRAVQDAEGPEPEAAPCDDCTFLKVEEIEELVKEGVCAPHDPAKLDKASNKTGCCGPKPVDGQQSNSAPALKSNPGTSDGSSLFVSVAAQVRRLQYPDVSSWWKKLDATDIALCGALALSGVALCIAINLHTRSR